MISTISQWKNIFINEDVNVCALAVEDYTAELTPLELELVIESVAIRKNTFATGRACAKSALLAMGVPTNAYPNGLLRQEDGAVIWPADCIGSLSHTNDWAMAAITTSGGYYQSIGIDIEKIDRVEKNMLRLIASDHERALLDENPNRRWGRVGLFSIKESVYKCLRPLYGHFIRFKDVEIMEFNEFEVAEQIGAQAVGTVPPIYHATVQMNLPELAQCCDAKAIDIRLAVLDTHVVSFVGYRKNN